MNGQHLDKKKPEIIEKVKQTWWVWGLNVVGKLCCSSRLLRLVGIDLSAKSINRTANWRAGGAPPLDDGPLRSEGKDTKEETAMMKYKEPLQVLCADLEKQKLTCLGTMLMHGVDSLMLSTRMRVIQYIREHYDQLAGIPIKRPIFVVGLPRTGTTLLFNLLAADPNRRFAKNWQAFSPTLNEKQAKMAVWAGMTATTRMVPGLKKVHEMSVDHPEECLVFMQPAVINFLHLVFNFLPNFYNYYKKPDLDMIGVYRFHKYVLQILQSRYPEKLEGEDKQWVLKTPAHLPFLDALLQIYPDACIVWTHRDLNEAIPSTASLCRHFQMLTQETINRSEIGKHAVDLMALWLNRATETRNNPKYEKNFCDIAYADLVKNPLGTVEKVYSHFGLSFPEQTKAAVKSCKDRMPRAAHGVHKYSLAQFDMTTEDINEACKPYLDKYRHMCEAPVKAS